MITVKLSGGLGNQMFQYALGKNLSIKNKTTLELDLTELNHRIKKLNYVFRNYDLDIFKINPSVTSLSKTPKMLHNIIFIIQNLKNRLQSKLKFSNYIAEKNQSFDENVLLTNKKNLYLSGFWQNEKYFKGAVDTIQKEFTNFRYNLTEASERMMKEITNSNSVCINFRRTDYVNSEKAKKFHGNLNQNYYKQAIDIITEKITNPHFYIFSDDIEWCKENVKTEYPTTFVSHDCAGTKFSDYLRLMIACKHYIIPNSTFAWWGAWLNKNPDKIVIAPKQWFANKTSKELGILPDEWITI